MGNNLYKNGMYIYINPTLLDASKTELDYLGLHGYYLVTGVQSSVTPQGFTTSMTALHEGIEFRAAELSPEVWDVTAEAPPPDIVVIDHITNARLIRERQVAQGSEGFAAQQRARIEILGEERARGGGNMGDDAEMVWEGGKWAAFEIVKHKINQATGPMRWVHRKATGHDDLRATATDIASTAATSLASEVPGSDGND